MKFNNGLWWPDNHKNTFDDFRIDDLKKIIPYVKDFDCVIQAGGCIGVWPNELKKYFKRVVTFEANDDNYECLIKNTDVEAYNKPLSNKHEFIDVGFPSKTHVGNIGSFQVVPGEKESITIDEYNLNPGLIYLVIEGYELFALMGAKNTIEKYKPTIVFQSKKLVNDYGVESGDIEKYLSEFGYKVVDKVHKSVICTNG